MRSCRNRRGLISVHLAVLLAGLAIALASVLLLQQQSVAAAKKHSIGRELAREQQLVRTVAIAKVREALRANDPRVFAGVTGPGVTNHLTRDARYSSRPASDPLTPGFRAVAILPPAAPPLFASTPVFSVPGVGVSPLDSLRQVRYSMPISFVLARRQRTDEPASLQSATQGALALPIREIPLTSFAMVATEGLDVDSGFDFDGPALVMGEVTRSESDFAFRLSPFPIDDSFIRSGERVWESPSLAASLLASLGDLVDPSSSAPQHQVVARKGALLQFDGHSLSGEDIPAGISVQTYRGSARVVIDVAALPQSNVTVDAGLPADPTNLVSAFHIACTTPLGRDRGVVVVGTTTDRLADIISTNGAVTLVGSHTGGPAIVASSFGGAYFDCTGNAQWNALLILAAPSPYVSATSGAASGGARTFSLASGQLDLRPGDRDFDSVSLHVTPSPGAFTVALRSAAWNQNQVWLESNGVTMRIGALTTTGAVFSGNTPLPASGQIEFTLSRSQAAVRLQTIDGVSYWDLPADRPRVEASVAAWSGAVLRLDVLSSGGGAAIGSSAAAGTIRFRGLLLAGRLHRYGPANYVISPSSAVDRLESLAPRMVVSEL